MTTTPKVMPFAVDRGADQALAEQIADGISRAIRAGYFAPGERLPNMADMAADLDVANQTMRQAVRRLVTRGQLVARPRVGIHVLDSQEPRFTRHVVCVRGSGLAHPTVTYTDAFRSRLWAKRVRLTLVDVYARSSEQAEAELQAILRENPVDLVVFTGHLQTELTQLCQQQGLPYIYCGRRDQSSGAAASHASSVAQALRQLGEQAVALGNRRCDIVTCGADEPADESDAILRAAGLDCRLIHVPQPAAMELRSVSGEAHEQAALQTMQAYFAATTALPDLLYFTDDYLARGGLLALALSGLQAPRDISVAVLANREHLPGWPIPLTRVEVDPRGNGYAAADLALAVLDGRAGSRHVLSQAAFVPGETLTPPTRRRSPDADD